MRILLLWILLSFFFQPAFGQLAETGVRDSLIRPRNTVSIELGGSGLVWSANYEYVLISRRWFWSTTRIGLGSFLFGSNISQGFTANFFRRHSIELGTGYSAFYFLDMSLYNNQGSYTDLMWYLSAGYRIQPLRKYRIMLRGCLMYVHWNQDEWEMPLWFGTGVGFAF